MTASITSKTSGSLKDAVGVEEKPAEKTEYSGDDSDFGGPEERRKLERRLLWKLDSRMSILVVIYILNYVRYISEWPGLCPILNTTTDRPQQRWVSLCGHSTVVTRIMSIPVRHVYEA